MAWVLVVVAGLFETAFAVSLKQSETFTRLWWSVSFITCAVVSFVLLSMALKTLPVGTAYSVWVGVGAAGTVILGIILFKEPANALRLASIALVIAGIAGLKVATPA